MQIHVIHIIFDVSLYDMAMVPMILDPDLVTGQLCA